MWELDHKEGWAPKNWCFWTVVLEKTFESNLDNKEIKPDNPKGDQSWIFIGRTDAEAEILWPPDAKSWLTGKDPDAGKDWGQEEKGVTNDEMAGWHHCLNGHGFEQAPGVGDGQGGLARCSPWDHKESDMTEWLNNNNKFKAMPTAQVYAKWTQVQTFKLIQEMQAGWHVGGAYMDFIQQAHYWAQAVNFSPTSS